jgi:hypothetical protein
MTSSNWTIAWRKPTANRFQRVTNWSGTWTQARDLASTHAAAYPELEVWVTSTKEYDETHPTEDSYNILTHSGRRVRVVDDGELPL